MGARLKIAVVGAGKMGLPLACAFADHGGDVIACDINPATVRAINAGIAPFDEPALSDLLARVVSEGRLRGTSDTRAAASASSVCVVIVPVMLTGGKAADLSIIESVTKEIAAGLRPGSMVIYETTLPVGQTRKLGSLLEGTGFAAGIDFDLVFSPERVKSRDVLRLLSVNPKVVGALTPAGGARAEAFYKAFLGAPVTNVGSLEAAEFVKLAGMVYRDVNIALANELANYSQTLGLDFDTVRRAANTDGEANVLLPGIGVGGHCTPVYPYFLIRDAEVRMVDMTLATGARAINDSQPARVLARAGSLRGKRVVILGLGFRPQVKETEFSPAFTLRKEIEAHGGMALANDPLFTDAEIRHLGFVPSPIESADIVVLNTAHEIYRHLDFGGLAREGVTVIVDGRDLWDPATVMAAGLKYVGVGKPSETTNPTLA